MRTVVITGAAGFLGRHVAEALLARGETVRSLDLVAPHLAGVEAITGSVTDLAIVREALQGADGLVHAAAIADLWVRDSARYEAVNVEGTRTVLNAAAEMGIARAVHVSSYTTLVAGGTAEPTAPLTEDVVHPPEAMLGPYPASKRRAELVAEEMAAKGLAVSIVQPSAPIGPGDRNLTPPGRMLRDAAAGRLPAVLDCLMNVVDAASVAAGIVAALGRGAPGRRYLLTGEDIEMAELARRIAAAAGVKAPRARVPGAVALAAARVEAGIAAITGRPPQAPLTGVRLALRRRRFSNARAREELGFAPAPIDSAIAGAVAWLRETGRL
ncbi:MAG: NAD-dependent epimerase/dehydratase family protein [Pseudomonadota bacterium]